MILTYQLLSTDSKVKAANRRIIYDRVWGQLSA